MSFLDRGWHISTFTYPEKFNRTSTLIKFNHCNEKLHKKETRAVDHHKTYSGKDAWQECRWAYTQLQEVSRRHHSSIQSNSRASDASIFQLPKPPPAIQIKKNILVFFSLQKSQINPTNRTLAEEKESRK